MNPTKLMIGSLLLTVLSLGMVPSATAAGTHICDVDYACLCVDAEGGPECEDDSRASFSSEINYGPVDEKVCISTSNPICSIGPILPGGGN